MAQSYDEGSQVLVVRSNDDSDWEGQVVTLASFDAGDESYPYNVENEDGDTIWVNEVAPVAGSVAPSLYWLVSQFMKGEITSSRVAKALPRGHGVIIQLNPSERFCNQDANEGPYVVVQVELLGSKLGDHMRESLSLDSDLFRASTTDSTVNHSMLLKQINTGPLLVETIVPTAGTQQSQSGVTEMTQQTKVTAIVSRAKSATMTAASLQAGKALNAAALKAAKAQAPMLLRGYLDHPVAPAVIAIGLVAGTEFIPAGPTREKVAKAADLMLVAALTDGADKFLDIEGMIDKVFAGLPAEAKALIESA